MDKNILEAMERIYKLAIQVEPNNFESISGVVIGQESTALDKVRKSLKWIESNLKYTADHHDTVTSLLRDGKGNCGDHTGLLMGLLNISGVESRVVREINVQPPSQSRRNSAKKMGVSLFGFEHNDHVWLEIRACLKIRRTQCPGT